MRKYNKRFSENSRQELLELVRSYKSSQNPEEKNSQAFKLYKRFNRLIGGVVYKSLNLLRSYPIIRSISGFEVDDLRQIGFLGLEEAIRTFDECKGKFETHAIGYIRFAIFNSLRDQLPKPNIGIYYNIQRLRRAGTTIQDLIDIYLTIEQYKEPIILNLKNGQKLEFKREAFKDFVESAVRSNSLKYLYENPMPKEDSIGHNGCLEEIHREELKAKIQESLDCLKYQQKLVLVLRNGLDMLSDDVIKLKLKPLRTYTLEKIGFKLKLTKERIRQIEDEAIERLTKRVRKLSLEEVIEDPDILVKRNF
ncbi:sigma-70 family RNA polymerase sigma factor [Candidatus Woesearchaeota archaeon]|nr:sigma-70 family RNA polymerase sigma factor [Candidatus Woesearchaeota archaeon]